MPEPEKRMDGLKEKKHLNDQEIGQGGKLVLEAQLAAAKTVADLRVVIQELLKRV